MIFTSPIRILFLADTHLGFDLPFKPRIQRRRRGHDFFANYELALKPALRKEVDLVVHGGDLFYRARVPPALVEMALEPLVRVAKGGVPVYLVPGNHERSRIPNHLLTAHPNLHIFHQPDTFTLSVRDRTIALSGFPFHRHVGEQFGRLLAETCFQEHPADIRFLCLHQAVEGAQVGPSDYTFRRGPDIIPGLAIPAGFDAVLSGHIHRAQTLTRDLAGRPLAAPVIYPGSIERTAFAERFEEKSYVKLSISHDGADASPKVNITRIPLPARPMVILEIDVARKHVGVIYQEISRRLAALDPEAIVRIDLVGLSDMLGQEDPAPATTFSRADRSGVGSRKSRHRHPDGLRRELPRQLTTTTLRSIAPPTMNLSLRLVEEDG